MSFYRKFTPRQEFAKNLLGRTDRIDVWAAVIGIEPPETFRQVDILELLQGESAIPPSCIVSELKAMRELGMIVALPRNPEDPHAVYLEKTSSPVWEVARVAIEAVDRLFPIELQNHPG